MTENEWLAFALSEVEQSMEIGDLDETLCLHLQAQVQRILLRNDYARKLIEKHDIGPNELPMIEQCLLFGTALYDKEHHLTFLHFDEYVFGRWYKLTVKSANYGNELWVATFHRSNDKQSASMRRTLPILRGPKV